MLYEDAGNGFEKLRADLETAVASIEALEEKLEEKDAPFPPGRGIIEKWKME
jgi:exonuclease VII small subunit